MKNPFLVLVRDLMMKMQFLWALSFHRLENNEYGAEHKTAAVSDCRALVTPKYLGILLGMLNGTKE